MCPSCGLRDVPDWMYDLLKMWNASKQWAQLPFPGSIREQPELFLRCMEIIAEEVEEVQYQAMEDAKKKAEQAWGKKGWQQ